MKDAANSELFHHCEAYLSRQIGLRELEDWVMQRVEYFLNRSPESANAIVGLIVGGLSEMGLGHRTEEEFRSMLEEHLKSATSSRPARRRAPPGARRV